MSTNTLAPEPQGEAIATHSTPEPAIKRSRPSQSSDDGASLLPDMEHFVNLMRRVKRPRLALHLIERANGAPVAEVAAHVNAASEGLKIDARRAAYRAVATLDASVRQRIERACERIDLLGDEYGSQAVQSLLDEESDSDVLAPPTDAYSRALHLCLRQDFPEQGAALDVRFDRAERQQTINRQSSSATHSSHYLGPKGVVPKVGPDVEDAMRMRIAALFPKVPPEHILIEQFTRRDLTDAAAGAGHEPTSRPAALVYTLTATFNGTQAQYRQVNDGHVESYEVPAAMSAFYSWEPQTGALSVLCEDRDVRRELALVFRDVVLACGDGLNDMPLRQFDLLGFLSPEMIHRLERERVPGIDRVTIAKIKVARQLAAQASNTAAADDDAKVLASTMLLSKDRRDNRDLYSVVREDFDIDDLTGYVLQQVTLTFKMSRQAYRRAHTLTVQIVAPNRLTAKSKTEDDRQRVLEQLARIGVLKMV